MKKVTSKPEPIEPEAMLPFVVKLIFAIVLLAALSALSLAFFSALIRRNSDSEDP